MQVGGRLKEADYSAEISVDIDLFKKRLSESVPILFVLCIGSIKDLLVSLPDPFMGEIRVSIASRFLTQAKRVLPCRRFAGGLGKVDLQLDFRVTPCGQAPNLRHPAPIFDGLLEPPPFGFRNVTKETEHIQEVGFPGSIRSDDELALAQIDSNVLKIAPVLR